MRFFGGLGQMLTRLPHLSQFSSAFSVVISGARVFPKHGICQGLRLLVRGQSPLFTVSVYSSEFVSVSIFLLCVCHLTRSDRCLAVFLVLDALFGHFCLGILLCQ